MWNGSSKIHFFIDFWHPFSWRLWRTGMLLFTKLKGHRSNFHYSGPQKAHLVDPEFKIQVTKEFKIYKSASEHPVLAMDWVQILTLGTHLFIVWQMGWYGCKLFAPALKKPSWYCKKFCSGELLASNQYKNRHQNPERLLHAF
jgi:hypothetical protein